MKNLLHSASEDLRERDKFKGGQLIRNREEFSTEGINNDFAEDELTKEEWKQKILLVKLGLLLL